MFLNFFFILLTLCPKPIKAVGDITLQVPEMGGELSEAHITEYRDAFKLFDTDGDGTISVQVI